MKKFIAFCLALCLTAILFVSCDEVEPVETTSPSNKQFNVEDSILTTCIGQADENGVYVVPDTVKMIGEGAFTGDETLKEVYIGSHVKSIGSGAFQGCTSLRKVVMEEGVSDIGSHAFYACTSLSEITLSKAVTEILPYTFYGCTSLETLDLSTVREIGDYAMWYCESLEDVTVSPLLTRIGKWAFARCNALTDFDLSSCTRLTEIDDYSFAGCTRLSSLVIPEGTTRVGVFAFYDCTRIGHIEIPESVKRIDFGAFNYTQWFQENSEPYLIVGDGILIKCTVHPSELDLSDKGIRVIASTFWNPQAGGYATEYGYKYATELESIVIPEGVTTIEVSAFEGCYNLQSISLPSTLQRIEDSAFNIYSEYTSIETTVTSFDACPELSYIGSYAFNGCRGIEKIVLPPSVDFVGLYAFSATNAYESFMNQASESDKVELLITGDGVLLFTYVPNGQTAIEIPEGVRVIGGGALCGWDNPLYISEEDKPSLSASGRSKHNISFSVTSLKLPSTLEIACNSAFYRMTRIEDVVLPEKLRVIGDSAFAFCTSLRLTDNASIAEIGDCAFSNCTSFDTFRFTSATEKIGSAVFEECSSLVSVYLPRDGKIIGEDLFNVSCTALREVFIDPLARPRIYSVLGHIETDVKVRYYIHD